MADELKLPLDPFTQTGLTLLGKVYASDGTQEGSTVSMVEDGAAIYIGDFPLGAVADGEYLVRFETNSPNRLYGIGRLYVRNNAEITNYNVPTKAELDNAQTAITNEINANETKIDALETKAQADARQTTLQTEHDFTQSELAKIGASSASLKTFATSYVLTTGTQTANTFASTKLNDSTRHTHTDSAGSMDLYYEFDIGTGVPVVATVVGALTGTNDSLQVMAYNWSLATWEQVGTRSGTTGTGNSSKTYNLLPNHVGTGVDLGKVRIRYYKASGLTSATLYVDQILIGFLKVPFTPSEVWGHTGRSLDTAVETDAASRTASKADITLLALETTAQLAKDEATLSRKHLTNRDKIDIGTKTLTRYDDDGLTPIEVFDLKGSDGLPNATTPYEKVPQ